MRAFPCRLAVLLLLTACGGGGATGAEPKSAAEQADAEGSSDTGSASDRESSSDSSAPTEQPKGPNCDDGTCSACGSGICPTGWYCDEKASGGAACSWLTECADKPTCSCVTRVLGSACKCREEGGGLKVACD